MIIRAYRDETNKLIMIMGCSNCGREVEYRKRVANPLCPACMEEHKKKMQEERHKRYLADRNTKKKPICVEDKMYCCPRCWNNLMFKWKRYPTVPMPKENGLKRCKCCSQAIDWS